MPPKGTTGDETQIRLKSAASTELDAWTPPVQDREGARCLEQQTTPLATPEDIKRQHLCNHVQSGQLPRSSSVRATCVLALHNGAWTPRSEQQADTDDMVCAENTR